MSGLATDLFIIIIAGLIGGVTARLLRQPLILGYILAGILVGPYTGGITVGSVDGIERLADLGVALLLFSLGLEFRFQSLRPIKKIAVYGSLIQVALTFGWGFLVGKIFGWQMTPSLWLAAAVVSSSTAVILKTLVSRGYQEALSGRIMLGMSIIQDLSVIPIMILLTGICAGQGGFSWLHLARPLAASILFLFLIYMVGMKVIPKLLKRVAQWNSQELFLLSVTALGLGIGYLTYFFGLSFAFGAFVAGLVLSESDYSHKALSELMPVRDIFGLLFFVSVGMLIEPAFLLANAKTIGLMTLAAVTGKGIILACVAWIFGYRRIVPLALFLGMLPISEIAFVLIRTGLELKALSPQAYSIILNGVILSMLVGPLATGLAAPIYRMLRRVLPEPEFDQNLPEEITLANHVVIAGGDGYAGLIAEAIQKTGLPCLLVEPHFQSFRRNRELGLSQIFGDPGRQQLLENARLASARLLIVAVGGYAETMNVVRTARQFPQCPDIIVSTRNGEDAKRLQTQDFLDVIQPDREAAYELTRRALSGLHADPALIERHIDALRNKGISQSRGPSEAPDNIQKAAALEKLIGMEWLDLKEECSLTGQTIGQADIRATYGISVVGVLRDGVFHPLPHAGFLLQGGDRLAVIGNPEDLNRFQRVVCDSSPATANVIV